MHLSELEMISEITSLFVLYINSEPIF